MADTIVATLSPALHLRKSRGAGWRSKLGGVPLLPATAAWPRRDTRPLTALAQIDCSEATAVARDLGLPAHGLLQFFYDADEQPWGFDPADAGGAAVRYWPDPAQCRVPTEIPETIMPQRSVGLHRILTLPPTAGVPGETLAFTLEQHHAYADFYTEFTLANLDEHPEHWLGGHPDQVQNEMALDCQLVSNGVYCGDSSGYESARGRALAPGAADWTLLFQCDSDDDLQLMWGDLGRIYFWIRKQDLRAGDFSRTWTILQCH